jgi:hypothetical protein
LVEHDVNGFLRAYVPGNSTHVVNDDIRGLGALGLVRKFSFTLPRYPLRLG